VRSGATRLVVPLSRRWPSPTLDGRATSYFEWTVAAWVEAPRAYRSFARVALRSDGSRLWLRVDPQAGARPSVPLVVTMATSGRRMGWTLPADLPEACAVDRFLEAVLPLPEEETLLGIECGGEKLPPEGLYRLEFQEVDEP